MDEQTLQFYRRQAETYADWAKAPSARLVQFLTLMPPASSILELGCGAGHHSAKMLEAGFKVRPTDGSPEMAAIASRRLGHPVETMLFDQLDARETYDGVWASACLLHVPRDQLSGILFKIHRALKPAGVFYASFKIGEYDGRDTVGRYYNYPSPHWLQSVYAEAGSWMLLPLETSEIKSFDGEPATMLHLTARKLS